MNVSSTSKRKASRQASGSKPWPGSRSSVRPMNLQEIGESRRAAGFGRGSELTYSLLLAYGSPEGRLRSGPTTASAVLGGRSRFPSHPNDGAALLDTVNVNVAPEGLSLSDWAAASTGLLIGYGNEMMSGGCTSAGGALAIVGIGAIVLASGVEVAAGAAAWTAVEGPST